MDLLSLRDLPLALAFGIVCLWFLNQNNIEFGKKYVALSEGFNKEYRAALENYNALVTGLAEERRQWITDQRTERAYLIEVLNKNTEALTKNANENNQLRQHISSSERKDKGNESR